MLSKTFLVKILAQFLELLNFKGNSKHLDINKLAFCPRLYFYQTRHEFAKRMNRLRTGCRSHPYGRRVFLTKYGKNIASHKRLKLIVSKYL